MRKKFSIIFMSLRGGTTKQSRGLYRRLMRLPRFARNDNWRQGGFTLVELLVVIAIIGVLSSLLMVNFIGARQRGRDAQRKSNIRQIQSALELYRSDQSNYPNSLSACGSSLVDPVNGTTVYMKTIPCDPLGGSYQYTGTSTNYTIVGCLENVNDTDGTKTKPAGFNACTSGNYFVATNP